MTYSQVYKSHYSRMVRDRLIKSAIYSLFIGLAAAAIVAFVTIFTEFNGLWTAIGCGLGVAAIMTPVLYFAWFHPTEKSVAESLDRLGFDERIITMLELEGDNSVVAKLQRNDAIATVTAAAEKNGGKVASPAMPFYKKIGSLLGLNARLIIAASVIVAVSVVTLVITGLPHSRVEEIFLGTNSYSISYNAGEHGYLVKESGDYKFDFELARVGKFTADVNENTMSERIVVCAYNNIDAPFMFVGWSDDYVDEYNAASRSDKALMNLAVTAKYAELDVVEDLPLDGLGKPGDGPNDGNNDAPPQNNDDLENTGKGGNNPPQISPPGNGASASETVLNSEVVDGQTNYQESFEQNYEEAMQRLSEGQEIPESLRKVISAYFEALR